MMGPGCPILLQERRRAGGSLPPRNASWLPRGLKGEHTRDVLIISTVQGGGHPRMLIVPFFWIYFPNAGRQKAIHAAVKETKYLCSARLIGCRPGGELGCPSPPPLTPAPLLAVACTVCTHTHTNTHTTQVKGHLCPFCSHQEEPSIRQHSEKVNRQSREGIPSVTKVCYRPNRHCQEKCQKKKLREPRPLTANSDSNSDDSSISNLNPQTQDNQEYSYLLDAYYTSATAPRC